MIRALLAAVGFLAVAGVAQAQTSCSTLPQATVLSTLSDNAAAGSITPQTIRNVVCSTLPALAAAGQVQAPTTSPFTFTSTVPGTLLVGGGKIELSGDSGSNWYTIGLTGGTISLLKNSSVRVTWTQAGASNVPAVVFFPGQ